MAYATVQDLIDRYGQTEMIRLTTPADQDMDGVVKDVAEAKLADASALIDTFVGRRYRVPMDIPPQIVVAKCCVIARYELANGEQKTPTEAMRRDYEDAMAFLRQISVGQAVLELDEIGPSPEGYSRARTREQIFGNRFESGWP